VTSLFDVFETAIR